MEGFHVSQENGVWILSHTMKVRGEMRTARVKIDPHDHAPFIALELKALAHQMENLDWERRGA